MKPAPKKRSTMTKFLALAVLVAAVMTGGASARSAAAPVNSTPPAVSGTAKVGEALTVSNGTWTGAATKYAYQWQRCLSATSCSNIAGATSKTYTVATADGGRTLRSVVSATNADGTSTANSNQTAAPRSNRSSLATPTSARRCTLQAVAG